MTSRLHPRESRPRLILLSHRVVLETRHGLLVEALLDACRFQ